MTLQNPKEITKLKNCGILLPWFWSACPLRLKGHCKSIQSCSGWLLCPVTKYFWSDESGLFWDYTVVGNRGTRLIRIKVTRFQPRWTRVEHFELARLTNLKNILWGMLFYLLWFVESIQKHVEGYIMEHVILLDRSRSLPRSKLLYPRKEI